LCLMMVRGFWVSMAFLQVLTWMEQDLTGVEEFVVLLRLT
jgi:hypothetical protein